MFTHMPGDSYCRWFRSLDVFMWHLSSTSWLPFICWFLKIWKMTNSGFESLRLFASLAQTEWLPDWESENVCLSCPDRMTPWLRVWECLHLLPKQNDSLIESLRMFASLAQTEWLPDFESSQLGSFMPWLMCMCTHKRTSYLLYCQSWLVALFLQCLLCCKR